MRQIHSSFTNEMVMETMVPHSQEIELNQFIQNISMKH